MKLAYHIISRGRYTVKQPSNFKRNLEFCYLHFGASSRSHLQQSKGLILEDGNERLSDTLVRNYKHT